MTTVILNSAGRSGANFLSEASGLNQLPFSGRITNRISSVTGNALGSVGRDIDEALFGADEVNYVRGSKLLDLNIQTSAYGEAIPIIFGRVKISGNIIWAKPIKEVKNTTEVNSGGKGAGGVRPVNKSETRYSYFATLAITICEGEITNIEKFYADGKLINPATYCTSYTIYKGTENQAIDPVIQSYEGTGKTPAFKGLAYIVFEDFALSDFNNRVPNFTFEVARLGNQSENSVEQLVTAINIIPGSGEFVYDTNIKTKTYGYDLAGKWIETAPRDTINLNNASSKADILVALDNLQQTFPNLEYVSVIVTWFASSLDIANCIFEPKIEYKTGTKVIPTDWSVAGKTRATAGEMTRDSNGNILYGGTPSDDSIVNLITELKVRGYKVMLYPMPFVEIANKPWRGRITGGTSDVANFFTRVNGYNNFILHYANLAKNKVDAFIIGTEMVELTSITDGTNYPSVTQFVNLAASVKTIMGSNTKISYAADWSEYHSKNGVYYLDPLWASPNIDFIAIDAYFPLLDEPQSSDYNLTQAINGWDSGEGFDWYYTDVNRTIKANLQPQYAWKNIEYWWNNYHYNPDNSQTAWVPQSKKIWFTEYGFPAVDGALNQPNVFYNPDSIDGALPRFSKGYTDFFAQKLGIEATEKFWLNSNMVEEKFLWCFDARPYPYYPELKEVWSDGNLWAKGHWVNGKLGMYYVDLAIKEIAKRTQIPEEKIDVATIKDILEGYVVNSQISAANAISHLQMAYSIDRVNNSVNLKFTKRGKEKEIEILEEDFAEIKNFSKYKMQQSAYSKTPTKIDFNFISKDTNFSIANQNFVISSNAENTTSLDVSLPIVMNNIIARSACENILLEEYSKNKIIKFTVPKTKYEIEIGDILKLPDNKKYRTEILNETENNYEITATQYFKNIYNNFGYEDYQTQEIETLQQNENPYLEIIDTATIEENASTKPIIKLALSSNNKNYQGAEIFYKLQNEIGYKSLVSSQKNAVTGFVLNNISNINHFVIDEISQLEVQLISGSLNSISDAEFLNNKNIAKIGDEIIAFKNAVLIAENKYKISHLKRGLFGTEQSITASTQNKKFILLDDEIISIELPISSLNSNFDIKAVSFGNEILGAENYNFTFLGNNLKPLSPVNLTAKKQVNNDVIFSFTRRSRDNYHLLNQYSDIPLAESEEKYLCEIYDGTNLKRQFIINSPQFTYTETQQILDFGSLQNSYKLRIYQVSGMFGKGNFNESNLSTG
jgi:hypothetical protein